MIVFLQIILLTLPLGLFGSINISPEEAQKTGILIWRNECKGSVNGLTSWNQGEEFASLGIGHFIWFPKGQKGIFEERFPALIKFLESQNQQPPLWLNANEGCPWSSREDFLADFNSLKMIELRAFLQNTVSQQAIFMADRLEKAFPKILAAQPDKKREQIEVQFYRVAKVKMGTYALVDYVNFKGEGVLPQEKYNGYGWGLLQVLEEMSQLPSTMDPLQAFTASAKAVLNRRVEQSPPERNERRWLLGWNNRINTYLQSN